MALSTMLAMRGWTVRVHERNEQIREVGAGIYLRRNTLRVLEVLGVADEVKSLGLQLERGRYRDGVTGQLFHDRPGGEGTAAWICPRQSLMQALETRARAAGVEILTDSEVTGADPSGVLRTKRGDFEADLVVGADGVSSNVRESLGLTKLTERLPSVVTRYLAPTREVGPEPYATMWWSGKRRIGIAPCGPDMTYVYMVCHESDLGAKKLPMDLGLWSASFPMLADKLALLEPLPAIQNNYRIVTCKSWHSGRVAILGDAAHGLPPLLGQGAGLALSNANALATTVGDDPDRIPDDIATWERKFRKYADITQFWSMHLDKATNQWPKALLPLRKPYLGILGTRRVRTMMAIADRFPIRPAEQLV